MTQAEHAYWDAQWQINVLEAGRKHVDSTPIEDLIDLLLQWPKPRGVQVIKANSTGTCV